MKILLVISFFWSAIGFAVPVVSLDCTPTTPCKYVGKGLRGCISKVTLTGIPNGPGEVKVHFRPAQLGHEVQILPQKSKVVISAAIGKLAYTSADGDQWGQLQSALGRRYVGQITIDQDFPLDVSCSDKTVGFE